MIEGAVLVGFLSSWLCWNIGRTRGLVRGRREGRAAGRREGYERGFRHGRRERHDFAMWEDEI